jgi:hypothetical protein
MARIVRSADLVIGKETGGSMTIRFGLLVALGFLTAAPAHAVLPVGHPDSFWRRDVTSAPLDAQSAAVIAWLAANGGFGTGQIRVDFSIEVNEAGADAPFVVFEPGAEWFAPDCDERPVPLPAGGALAGESGYTCTGGGDCTLIVWHAPSQKLYESLFTTTGMNGHLEGGCLAIWQPDEAYGPEGRGQYCASATGSGMPIAPLLFDADEVAAGEIAHAIRFNLPSTRILRRTHVSPASHAGNSTGPLDAPPVGARLRLRADYPLASLPNEGARVVARALQRYGMILDDAGNIALTARSDRATTARWSGLLGSNDLAGIAVTDFAMIEAGERFPNPNFENECVRATPEASALMTGIAACVALTVRRLAATSTASAQPPS